MNAEIIAVGTELLMGQIVNTNSAYLAQELAKNSIPTYYQQVVGDNEERMYEAIELAVYRASHYAELPMAVDRLNPKVIENATAFEAVSVSYAENMSFVMTELISLDEAFLNQFVAEKRPDLAYFVEKVIRQKKHTLSKDAEQVLANFDSAIRSLLRQEAYGKQAC